VKESGIFSVLLVLVLSLLEGCASAPNPVSEPPPEALPFARALADPAAFHGRSLRWGGELVRIENRSEDTLLEILARPLNESGLPDIGAPSAGRFLARVPGFVDPAAHPVGTRITVVGTLVGSRQRHIGDYLYRYPVVAVSRWHDWGVYQPPPPEPEYDPWFWDPWFWGYGGGWGPYR